MFDEKALRAIPGKTAVWLENLATGETRFANPDEPFIAASVIKLGVLLEAFRRFEEKTLDPDGLTEVKPSDKVPSCGAITYMHDNLSVSWRDLATLMVILSDNTATNMLIDRLGISRVNRTLEEYGLTDMRLRRKMFDAEAAARGLQNTITASSVARFFRLLYEEKLVSPRASREMLAILKNQRLNGKIPFYLHPQGIPVAHKTGEDDGTSHDAGIVFLKEPIVAVFLSNDTDVPRFERFIQDTCRGLLR